MTLGRDVKEIAGDLHPVAVEFQTAPNRKVKVSVEHAPCRWKVELMEQAAGADEGHVVTRTVVCYKAVEVSEILKELLAERNIKAVRLDVPRRDGSLKYFAVPALDTV